MTRKSVRKSPAAIVPTGRRRADVRRADLDSEEGKDALGMHDAVAAIKTSTATVSAAIGTQIRWLRRTLGVSAIELAKRADVSNSMLSKIEHGLATPSISTLVAIASVLDVPVARFFASYDERRDLSIVRAGQGVTIERRGSVHGHRYELLGHSLTGELFVEPYLVTLTEEAEPSPNFQHTGMEFLYLLSGEMTYRYGDRTYELHSGDALVFDATALHGPEVLKKRPIVYLSVVLNLRA